MYMVSQATDSYQQSHVLELGTHSSVLLTVRSNVLEQVVIAIVRTRVGNGYTRVLVRTRVGGTTPGHQVPGTRYTCTIL